MASADFSRELPQEISPSKVRNLSARAARLYIHCLSVSLDFALIRMLIAQCLPQNRFVFLRSCFLLATSFSTCLTATTLWVTKVYYTISCFLLSEN